MCSVLLLMILVSSCYASDERLAQPVTYQGGYKRLHAVAEDLTAQTGVVIRAGGNKQDWRVRDIPLVVCVKDMPLAKLLDAIAECAHVTIGAEKIAGAADDNPVYKFYRSKKQLDDMAAVLSERAEANRQHAAWTWDTIVACADLPDSDERFGDYSPSDIRQYAQVMKYLGMQGRAKLLSGDCVRVSCDDGSDPSTLAAMEPIMKQFGADAHAHCAIVFDAGNLTSCKRTNVSFLEDIQDTNSKGEPRSQQCFGSAQPMAEALAAADDLHLPKEPDTKQAFRDDDFPAAGFKELKSDDDWKQPSLQKNIKLNVEIVQGGMAKAVSSADHKRHAIVSKWDEQRAADGLIAIARAAGLNLVCEDYVSQYASDKAPKLVAEYETTPAKALKSASVHWPGGTRWFYNQSENTLVGWVTDWITVHQSLMPEQVFSPMRTKMETTGAELDDVMSIAGLTADQVSEWFERTDLSGIGSCGSANEYLVARIYQTLNAQQRATTKSHSGLPLGALGVEQLGQIIKDCQSEYGNKLFPGSSIDAGALFRFSGENMKVASALSDANLLQSLNMNVKVDQLNDVKRSGLHKYVAQLTGENVDITVQLTDIVYPVYTPVREAEFIEKEAK